MRWKVGVLRSGSENIDWTASGDRATWTAAGRRAYEALQALMVGDGVRQEYRRFEESEARW